MVTFRFVEALMTTYRVRPSQPPCSDTGSPLAWRPVSRASSARVTPRRFIRQQTLIEKGGKQRGTPSGERSPPEPG